MADLDAQLVSGLAPFASLDLDAVRDILALASRKHWDEGAVIFRADDPAERFFLLLDGAVRPVRTTVHGEQIVPLHIPSGQMFGIAVAMGLKTYPATATAATDCVTLSWPSRLWSELAEKYPGFASETWHELGERLQELHEKVAELSTRAVEQRVAAALLRMVNQSGRKIADGIEITFPITRAIIAEMTGTTLHTVSRLLSAWEKDGIVASERKHVTITDPHRLMLISEASG